MINDKRNFDNQFNFSEHDPTITVFENNPAALTELFAAHLWAATHHLGTPDLLSFRCGFNHRR
jgi:hypothetical protein